MKVKNVNLLNEKTVTIDGCYVGNVVTVEREKYFGEPCLMAIYIKMSDTNMRNFDEYMDFLKITEEA